MITSSKFLLLFFIIWRLQRERERERNISYVSQRRGFKIQYIVNRSEIVFWNYHSCLFFCFKVEHGLQKLIEKLREWSNDLLTLCLMESGPIWLRDGDFRSLVRHFCKSLSDATPGKIFECLVARNTNSRVRRCNSFRSTSYLLSYYIVTKLYVWNTGSIKSKLSNVSRKLIDNVTNLAY